MGQGDIVGQGQAEAHDGTGTVSRAGAAEPRPIIVKVQALINLALAFTLGGLLIASIDAGRLSFAHQQITLWQYAMLDELKRNEAALTVAADSVDACYLAPPNHQKGLRH